MVVPRAGIRGSSGFRFIRLMKLLSQVFYTFDPSNDDYYNTVLRPVVDYCKTQDVYAIIDWHYINNTNYSTHQATTSEFWQYMAPRFANDSHVIFELFNEPTNGGSWPSVKSDMQAWVNIVRSYAPNNLIFVGGPTYDEVLAPQATNPIDGNNIVYVWHMYPGYGTSGWNDVNTLSGCWLPCLYERMGIRHEHNCWISSWDDYRLRSTANELC